MKKYSLLFLLTFLSFYVNDIYGQVTISGPDCVVPGTIYQYTISGRWDSLSTMKICVNGGNIYDSARSDECTSTEAPIASLLVKWNSPGKGALTLTSTSGKASLTVSVISALTPGSIDSASRFQTIPYDSIPSVINCSMNSGGSCNPSYINQWQYSSDMVAWADIAGANTQNLSFNSPLRQTTFFRRKVTEVVSGSIAYSNVAVINVRVTGTTMVSSRIINSNRIIANANISQKVQASIRSNYLNY